MLIGQEQLYYQILNFENAIYVEAPAGCGKTHACVKGVKILSDNNKLKPFQKVLILTFSKNARAQILNELSKYDKSELLYKHIEVANYHSFYKRYLDKYRDLIGFNKEFTIVDDEEYKSIFNIPIKKPIEFGDCYRLNGKYYMANNNQETTNKNIINNYNKYYSLSKKSGFITFNMFGILINELFDKSPKLIELISHDFPYIFLDEYQDTDNLQEYFLVRLFKHSKCIFFADPIQMIYSFKGAMEERLLNLKKFFPNIVEIKFEENFRYKSKQDIVSILENIRTGEILNYDNLISGKVFDVNIKLNDKSELQTKYGKNISPSNIFYSILNTKIVSQALKRQKSICILVKTNELVSKICHFFDEKGFKCNEIAESKYMLKLNIIIKKYFSSKNIDEIINYSLQIYALCKNNKKIDDVSFEKLSEINTIQFYRKKKGEFFNIKGIICKYNLEMLTTLERQNIVIEIINLIPKNCRNYSATHFAEDVMTISCVTDKNIDNIYTQKQYVSSYTNMKPGLYIANYHQCKGREFDEVIVVLDPGIENLQENRNILYVIHSRMKEKLFVGKYRFIGKQKED